jgi:hypothetical protein
MKTLSFFKGVRLCLLALLFTLPTLLHSQGVVITEETGTATPDGTAILDIRSADKGILIPRLTTAERIDITSPANGLLVFDTDKNSFYYFDATRGGWVGVVNYEPQPAEDEPLFVVRNSQDQIVFAVYEKGVRMYVEDDAKEPKGNKSGFAIGGLTGFKDNDTEYFRVTPDSVRILLREPATKGNKGGFAIGGLTGLKSDTVALMFVAPDSTRFYIDTEATTGGGKGNKGGFAIGGLTGFKNMPEEYLRVTRDSTRIYIDDSENGKGNKSGFAIGGLTGFKAGERKEFFNVAIDATGTIDDEARILWYPIKNAFLAGMVNIENPNDVGENSMAIGYKNKAKGGWSQALGYQSQSLGNYSTAIGNNAIAEMTNSFAFGEDANAKNLESYAIGRGAIAQGYRSFAFGSAGVDTLGNPTSSAKATGDYSFAIGQGSLAEGYGSFAIGLADTARAEYSLAMGYKASSTQKFATSIGLSTKSTGYSSISMGQHAEALADRAVSIGFSSKSSGHGSFSFGYEALAEGDYSISFGRQTKSTEHSTIAIGSYCEALGGFALGYISKASGSASIAIGSYNEADGNISVALGIGNKAFNLGSIAIGNSSESSADYGIAIGSYSAKAAGFGSTAIGFSAESSGQYSFAGGGGKSIGYSSTAFGGGAEAQGDYTFAVGRESKAIGEFSVAMGGYSESQGNYSVAIGNYTKAVGLNAMTVGSSTEANGDFSLAFGQSSIASQRSGIASGYQAISDGLSAISMGWETQALGHYSIAYGYQSKAAHDYAIAMGEKAQASGASSIGIGYNIKAKGSYSTAFGYYTTAKALGSFVIGQYNDTTGTEYLWINTDPVFVIGNGTADNARSNAFTVLRNGFTAIGHASPTQMLDVNGATRLRGHLFDYNNSSGSSGNFLKRSANGVEWSGLTMTDITGTLPVSKGGTGQTSLTAGRVLVGNHTSGIVSASNLVWDDTNGRMGVGRTTALYTLDISGQIRYQDSYYGEGKALVSDAYGVASWAQLDFSHISGTLSVNRGGTGRTSHTAYALIAGGTTTTGQQLSLATGSTGQILRSAGASAIPTWSTATYPATTSANGALYSSTANVVTSGTLPVAAGGTGTTSFTAGRILFGNTTGALNTNADLFWDNTYYRLGIGTTAPTSKLLVRDAVDATDGVSGAYIDIQNANGNSSNDRMSGIRFKNNIDAYMYKAGIFFNRTTTYGRGELIFATNNNADNSTHVSRADAALKISNLGYIFMPKIRVPSGWTNYMVWNSSTGEVGYSSGAACPEIHFFDGENLTYGSHILEAQAGRYNEREQIRPVIIPQNAKILEAKIILKEPETTYLDNLYLLIEDFNEAKGLAVFDTLRLEYASKDFENIQQKNKKYLTLTTGDSIDIRFASMPTERGEGWRRTHYIVSSGYYDIDFAEYQKPEWHQLKHEKFTQKFMDVDENGNMIHFLPQIIRNPAEFGYDYNGSLFTVNGIARNHLAAWTTASDARIKKNIKPIENALESIMRFNPVSFTWSDDYIARNPELKNQEQLGFIAQEVKEIRPEMVKVVAETIGDKSIEDFHLLNSNDLMPLMLKAIQEQQSIINSQQEQINELVKEIETIKFAISK